MAASDRRNSDSGRPTTPEPDKDGKDKQTTPVNLPGAGKSGKEDSR